MASPAEMDIAASAAEKELQEKIDTMSGRDLANFIAKNYGTAGYKRLGKIIVKLTKNVPPSN